MRKRIGLLVVSMVAVFCGTACEIYHDDDCDWWDDCDDYCYEYEDCDDDWYSGDDWDSDDWDDGDDWHDSDEYDYCDGKLDCLGECTEGFEDDGDVIKAVLCYSECFFSHTGCSPEEQTYDDPCDGEYDSCMTGCYVEMGCASFQVDCYMTCENDRAECKTGADDGAGDGSGDGSGDVSGDTDPAEEPSCKEVYDICVDGCEWDQWMCHENCYEQFYGCMEADPDTEASSGEDDMC